MEMPQTYSPIATRPPDADQFNRKARLTDQPPRKAALSDSKHSQPPRRSNTRTIKSEQQMPEPGSLFRNNAYNSLFEKELAPFDQIANPDTDRADRAKLQAQVDSSDEERHEEEPLQVRRQHRPGPQPPGPAAKHQRQHPEQTQP